jgi:hypothetical protein
MKEILEVRRNIPRHWVGDGFPVRSLFSYDTPELSPFLLFDYAGPHEFAPAEAPRGVGEHPHRGFETVTIVYQGELEHQDSGGNRGKIGPGDVQWMTAASGVVHAEFHSDAFTRRGGTFEAVQLWVNLPAREKLSPPRYQGIVANQIPRVKLADAAGSVRVIAGNFEGTQGPAQTVTPVELWEVAMPSGASHEFAVPDGHTAMLVVLRGVVQLNGEERLEAAQLAVFGRPAGRIALQCEEDATALVLAGEPIDEPVVGRGPFVMNSEAEILRAIADYQAGRMGTLS